MGFPVGWTELAGLRTAEQGAGVRSAAGGSDEAEDGWKGGETVTYQGLLTVEQCAEHLQCSVSQVERFIKSGELKRVPLSIREVGKGPRGRKCWRIRPSALEDFISSREAYEPKPAEPTKATPSVPARPQTRRITGTDGKERLRL